MNINISKFVLMVILLTVFDLIVYDGILHLDFWAYYLSCFITGIMGGLIFSYFESKKAIK